MISSPIARALLYLPGRLYELAVRARIALYRRNILKSRDLSRPVISVGNLTVGGTGKTPCVALLASILIGMGERPAIVSRGYRRNSSGRVLVSDGSRVLCGPEVAGDEPWLLARLCPGAIVIVDADRLAAGVWAEANTGATVFILDDAYQHLRLRRDLDIALIDAADDLESMRMIPFGRLREPLAGLGRADIVIATRSESLSDRPRFESTLARVAGREIPVFYSRHLITAFRGLDPSAPDLDPRSLSGTPVAVFSGIARPERLIADIQALGMSIVLRRDFRDHHRYSAGEIARLMSDAAAAGAEVVITTEKDEANLSGIPESSLTLPVLIARLTLACEDIDGLGRLLAGIMKRRRTRTGA